MPFEISTVKGFQDYLPPESLKRDAVKKIIEKYFKLYGFVPVETPVVEFDEIMKSDLLPSEQEDEAVSDRFRLKDRAGRNLGLRYEFTFQLSRIFKENPNLKLPFRRYQIGENFRDEPLRAGRTRQFTQCDIDIIGDSSTKADAECLIVFSDIFNELNIETEITVNNRKLVNAIIDSVEVRGKKQVMKELDKIDKLGLDQVKLNLRKFADTNQIITLFKLMEKDVSFFKANGFEGAEELDELITICKTYGVKVKCNPSLMRGFAYYTGNIFEIQNKNNKVIAGGGRYDRNVGKYLGKEIPAVGISFSLEALMGLCEEEIAKIKFEVYPKTILISISQDSETIKLAKKLRKENVSCIISSEKPGKSLEYANSQSIPYAVFIGIEEVQKKKFKLREMKSGEEEMLTEKQLIKKLAKQN